MAKQQKKSARRVPKATEPRMYGDGKPSQGEAQQAAASTTAPVSTTSGTAAPRTSTSRSAGVTPRGAGASGSYARVDRIVDYSYVLHDLRRLGIVAASILGGLVVLGVILH